EREIAGGRRRDRAAAAHLPDQAGLPVARQRLEPARTETRADHPRRHVEVVPAVDGAGAAVGRDVRLRVAAGGVGNRHRELVVDVGAWLAFVDALAERVVAAHAPAVAHPALQTKAHAVIVASGL